MKHSKIENWRQIKDKKDIVIIGNVYGDDRWPDGMMIRTSRVVASHVDKKGDTNKVLTVNSVYLLGKPFTKESK